MGFGFAADGRRAYLCCHDDAVVLEFELDSGRVTRQFPTASGCEFIISYWRRSVPLAPCVALRNHAGGEKRESQGARNDE